MKQLLRCHEIQYIEDKEDSSIIVVENQLIYFFDKKDGDRILESETMQTFKEALKVSKKFALIEPKVEKNQIENGNMTTIIGYKIMWKI